jgi:hypothetical protein
MSSLFTLLLLTLRIYVNGLLTKFSLDGLAGESVGASSEGAPGKHSAQRRLCRIAFGSCSQTTLCVTPAVADSIREVPPDNTLRSSCCCGSDLKRPQTLLLGSACRCHCCTVMFLGGRTFRKQSAVLPLVVVAVLVVVVVVVAMVAVMVANLRATRDSCNISCHL